MKSKKIIAIILLIILLFPKFIIAAEEKIKIERVENQLNNNLYIKVTSENNIKNVSLYKETENKDYLLFFNAENVNAKEKIYSISYQRLSTEKETNFKIRVTDTQNNQTEKIITAEKITEIIRPTPSQSTNPSTLPSTNPNTPARPSTTPSANPSTTPSIAPVTESISLNKKTLTLKTGGSATLTAKITTSSSNKSAKWKSSNTNVATVNSNGKVTAKAVGTAKITATSATGKTATATVTVTSNISSSTKPRSKRGDGYNQVITLGGRTYKLYKQSLGSYAGKHFNSVSNKGSGGTISNMGCGPSSIAIILSGYGYKYNPYDVGKKLMKNSKPSGLPSMKKEVTAMGRKAVIHNYISNYNKAYTEIRNALKSGHQIVLYVGKKSPKSYWYNFTHSGYHFISILGLDESNNKVYIGNPGVSGGWFNLSTVVKARGNTNGNMAGWLEIY